MHCIPRTLSTWLNPDPNFCPNPHSNPCLHLAPTLSQNLPETFPKYLSEPCLNPCPNPHLNPCSDPARTLIGTLLKRLPENRRKVKSTKKMQGILSLSECGTPGYIKIRLICFQSISCLFSLERCSTTGLTLAGSWFIIWLGEAERKHIEMVVY